MKIYKLDEIKSVLSKVDMVEEIEKGFKAYSRGEVVVPPIGEMHFDNPPGDVHIKYGYVKNEDRYVIKIASGFPQNMKHSLPNGNGMMLVFNQKTGQPVALLQDEGLLTDIRTAVAGAICAKYLAPKKVRHIGIVGTGVQAEMQLKYLGGYVDCWSTIVWGRSESSLNNYKSRLSESGYQIETTQDIDILIEKSQLIITATSSETPLITRVNPGTHITAMGSDTVEKQELDTSLIKKADVVVADSKSQCEERGEIHQAMKSGYNLENVIELGEIIAGDKQGRTSEDQVTVSDLTGVAVQDIQITNAVLNHLN